MILPETLLCNQMVRPTRVTVAVLLKPSLVWAQVGQLHMQKMAALGNNISDQQKYVDTLPESSTSRVSAMGEAYASRSGS